MHPWRSAVGSEIERCGVIEFDVVERADVTREPFPIFVGERRYVMFKWLTSAKAAAHELSRHRLSARLKRFNPFV